MRIENVDPKYLAIGPLDGRYHDIGEALAPYFSEFALMRYRLQVEVEWLIYLVSVLKKEDLPPKARKFNDNEEDDLRMLYLDFDAEYMERIKAIEKITNHDVKSVELFLDEWLDSHGMSAFKPLVHIGCTSEDINNLAYALMIKEAISDVWLPELTKLSINLDDLAREWADIPMLAHTHGQPATPTTLGKEVRVMQHRLHKQQAPLNENFRFYFEGKFNGATGTYGAMSVAYPDYDWREQNVRFVRRELRLVFNDCTTQIEPHDWIAELLDLVRRVNNIIRNIDQDMWTYISMEYLVQRPKDGEVGSSTMPHKVNPIRFENSEANCEVSNGLCQTLADQLMNSRMQRDLTDSSMLRNVGLAIGYSLQAIKYCLMGLDRIAPGYQKLEEDLEKHPEVLAEAIQTVLRKYGIPDAYDQLKKATRGKKTTLSDIRRFVLTDVYQQLADNPRARADLERLAELSPRNYTGLAGFLASP